MKFFNEIPILRCRKPGTESRVLERLHCSGALLQKASDSKSGEFINQLFPVGRPPQPLEHPIVELNEAGGNISNHWRGHWIS